jgi:Glucose-6-phosphate dehydrogenase, NAD binding domain
VLEKPFGEDLAEATELNALLARVIPEEAVFRVDHEELAAATPLAMRNAGDPSSGRCSGVGVHLAGGSIRSIVSTRSIDRSNEATRPTSVLSAHATR